MVNFGIWLRRVACAAYLAVFTLSSLCRAAPDATHPTTNPIPLGSAYAATTVNTTIYRVNALASAGGFQFVTYYDPDGRIVVGRRHINDAIWDLEPLQTKGKVTDAHNDVVLGISSDGFVHLSFNHHDQPLHYCVSAHPYDPTSFGPQQPMTGQNESKVTYPQFIAGPGGTLYFFYRDGASGNGSLCLNLYDPAAKKWHAIWHPLIDGENKCNPYWWRPAIAADGSIHLAWCWRDTPDAETNHDICYAVSHDGGLTWFRSDGKPQKVPITPENAEVIAAIPKGSNLINQCSAAVDEKGRPHLAQYMNDANGIPQYFHIWFDGTTWQRNQVSKRTRGFSLNGTGSLAISISRPEIAISKSGNVYFITRDAEFGGGIRLYRAQEPYQDWTAIDLTTNDLGNWEPEYDVTRWPRDGLLDLFVLPVRQGNHEQTTNFAAQAAEVLEAALP
ncbi:MAG: BNR repeat-containing protein [Tepidisphaeraceae bacterium]|jgi:hypothetical protein